jgi:hypothetical protein
MQTSVDKLQAFVAYGTSSRRITEHKSVAIVLHSIGFAFALCCKHFPDRPIEGVTILMIDSGALTISA